MGVFQKRVCERVKELWDGEGSEQEKWVAVNSALCESAVSLGDREEEEP